MNPKTLLRILSGIIGIGWIPLILWNWKIAGCIFLVMFSNNLQIKANEMEENG